MVWEQLKKLGRRAVVTESCQRLKKPFYWIMCSIIQVYIWMKSRTPSKSWQESLCTIRHFAGKVRRLGQTRQSIHRIVLQCSETEKAAFRIQIELMDPSFFVWLDETGCDKRDSLRRKAYGLCGSPPVSVRLNLVRIQLSAIATMSIKGIEVVTIYEENVVDAQVFSSYLEQ